MDLYFIIFCINNRNNICFTLTQSSIDLSANFFSIDRSVCQLLLHRSIWWFLSVGVIVLRLGRRGRGDYRFDLPLPLPINLGNTANSSSTISSTISSNECIDFSEYFLLMIQSQGPRREPLCAVRGPEQRPQQRAPGHILAARIRTRQHPALHTVGILVGEVQQGREGGVDVARNLMCACVQSVSQSDYFTAITCSIN